MSIQTIIWLLESIKGGLVVGLMPLLLGWRLGKLGLGIQGLLGTIILCFCGGWELACLGSAYSAWRVYYEAAQYGEGMTVSHRPLID